MKPYKTTEAHYCLNINDEDYLHNLGYTVLPQAEVTYKVSSESSHDYALYLVGNNKWKHSSSVTNKLLLDVFRTLSLREVQVPEVPDNLSRTVKQNETVKEDSGFSCDYYRVSITHPTTKEQSPYIAECNDVIESLQMTYTEANMFKAIWRTAAARTLGLEKSGNTSLRDAEKIKFFAERHYLRESVNANNTDERIVRKNK